MKKNSDVFPFLRWYRMLLTAALVQNKYRHVCLCKVKDIVICDETDANTVILMSYQYNKLKTIENQDCSRVLF